MLEASSYALGVSVDLIRKLLSKQGVLTVISQVVGYINPYMYSSVTRMTSVDSTINVMKPKEYLNSERIYNKGENLFIQVGVSSRGVTSSGLSNQRRQDFHIL